MPKLLVEVVRCNNLKGSDTFSKIDSYVQLSVASKTFKTRTIDNDENPNFNEKFQFYLPDSASSDAMKITLKDAGVFSDDQLAQLCVPIGSLPPWQEQTLTMPWEKVPGTITLKVTAELGQAPPPGSMPQQQQQQQQFGATPYAPAPAYGGGAFGAPAFPTNNAGGGNPYVAPPPGGFAPTNFGAPASFSSPAGGTNPYVASPPAPAPASEPVGGVYGGAQQSNPYTDAINAFSTSSNSSAPGNNPYANFSVGGSAGTNPYGGSTTGAGAGNDPYAHFTGGGNSNGTRSLGGSTSYPSATGGVPDILGLGITGLSGGRPAGATNPYGAPPSTNTANPYGAPPSSSNNHSSNNGPKFSTGYPG